MGMVPAAVMWTTVATCSVSFTLSRGETVTSVLRVMKDVGLKGCVNLLPLAVDLTELHVDSVFLERPVHPEKTDSETEMC
jgi:hypothetical protein